MNDRNLKHFLTLANRLSFTKAADELFISQPTLSREILSLETELGVKLFNRNNRGLTLTPEAQYLIPLFKQYLQYGDYIQLVASKLTNGLSGVLHVGYSGMADSRLISLIVAAAHEQYPEITIDLSLASHSDMLMMLREGHLDAAITIEPVVEKLSDIRWTPLIQKRMWVVLPSWHPLARKKIISPETLADMPLLVSSYSDSPFLSQVISEIYAKYGIKLNMVFSNSDPQSINYLVQTGKGASLSLGEKAVLEAQNLSVIALEGSWYTSVVLAVSVDRASWPLFQRFRDLSIAVGNTYRE